MTATSWTPEELIGLLRTPARGDASLILVHQLIAAKLNIAWGSDPTPVNASLSTADALLAAFDGRLPYAVKPSTVPGLDMTAVAEILEDYNDRALTPICDPLAPTLAPTQSERDLGALMDRVEVVTRTAPLSLGQRASLKSKLKAVKLAREDDTTARVALQAFVQQVRSLVRGGAVSRREGQALPDKAWLILAQLHR